MEAGLKKYTIKSTVISEFLRLTDYVVSHGARLFGKTIYRKELYLLHSKFLRLSSQRDFLGSDLDVCLKALVAGEDRRFYLHHGFDSKGVLRALYVYGCGGGVQGASTITQQLTRVLTGNYSKTFHRKIKEICLACALDDLTTKRAQAAIYLYIAYYGGAMNGIVQAMAKLNLRRPLSILDASSLVARLRYPEPAVECEAILKKINNRARYIEKLILKGEE